MTLSPSTNRRVDIETLADVPPVITFAGHAAYVLEHGPIALLVDPWFAGRAFNEGWDHLSPLQNPAEILARTTHIWVSHEHPDHFSPETLRMIPADRRRGMRFLFQKTKDRRVITYAEKAGFDCQELPHHRWVSLGPDFDVKIGPHRHMDSWMLARAGRWTVLNINDCSLVNATQCTRVKRHVGAVDVLLTQFSYAMRVGNPDEPARREAEARRHLRSNQTQIRVFRPEAAIPFASFVRFCHEENAYLNDHVNSAAGAAAAFEATGIAKAVVLRPGDRWTVGEPHDNDEAIAHYAGCYREARRPRVSTRPTTWGDVAAAAEKFQQRFWKRNSRFCIRAYYLSGFVRPAPVFLSDLGIAVVFDLVHGARRADMPRAECEIEMSADSLAYCLAVDWGAETLYVNGRYRILGGNERNFFRNFYPAILNNAGVGFPWGAIAFLLKEKLTWRPKVIWYKAMSSLRARDRTAHARWTPPPARSSPGISSGARRAS
jgi:hypothetical protein